MLVQNFLTNSAERFPDKVALICGGQRLTCQQIEEGANHLASILLDLGIRRHDRIIIFLDNSVESVISLFGILKVGATFVMLNPAIRAKKLNYILKDSGARGIVTHSNKFHVIKEAVIDATEIKHIIWDGKTDRIPLDEIPVSHHTWNSVQFNSQIVVPNTHAIDVDLATVIYTSGTTGKPKGVMSSHHNVISAATSITQYLKNSKDDIILSALPLSFDYGLYQILMAAMFGGTVILEKSFVYPYKILELLVQERATGLPLVPTMAALLLQLEELSRIDLSSLRYVTNTAASLPVAYIKKLKAILPEYTQIYSMYGLTECKRVSYLPIDLLDKKPESVGIPMPGVEVLIVNDNGEELGPGQIGELVIRGSNVMQGYWNSPEETAVTFRPGRYRGDTRLYSGDLFKKDKDGFLYFISRKDDMIKTKGERVSPKEIEAVLYDIQSVNEVAVFGVPDEVLGQAIKAIIKPTVGAHLTEKTVLRHCKLNLEPFMIPKFVEFVESFPKNASGKIDKQQLIHKAN